MNFDSFVSDTLATIVGGLILALFVFLFREWWHPLPDLSGRWYVETHTVRSTYGPYLDLHLKWEVMVSQEGPTIYGSMEKIFEKNSHEAFEYMNEKRIHAELRGYVDRFYLRRNRITCHLSVKGRKRDSSAVFSLSYKKGDLEGTFRDTAADAEGNATWSRSKDSPRFSHAIRYQQATKERVLMRPSAGAGNKIVG